MFKISQTEAAETMAIEVRVWARKHGVEVIDRELVAARISELRGRHEHGNQSYQTQAALTANVRTTLRKALEIPL
jgi:hypothetical protein